MLFLLRVTHNGDARMAKRFQGDEKEQAIYVANVMYHESKSSVRAIARHLRCSPSTVENLIVYSQDKWIERQAIVGHLPLHFEECQMVA